MKINQAIISLLVVVAAIFSGCAPPGDEKKTTLSPGDLPEMSDYSPPESGPGAIINFMTDGRGISEVKAIRYENDQCDEPTLIGTLTDDIPLLMGKKIPANGEFIFSMRYAASGYDRKWWCTYPYAFVPEIGKEYLATYGAQDSKCWMRVFEIKGSRENRLSTDNLKPVNGRVLSAETCRN